MPESAHVFFGSLSYIPYALVVYACLLFAPALAFFPRMTSKPAYFIGIPVVSLLINAFIAAVLFKLQWYTHAVVVSITLGFTVIAIARQWFSASWEQWEQNDKYIILINLMIMVPLLVKCGLSAFMDDDALVSWNAWAQYYYFGNMHPAVFSGEGGYPPFLPLLLSYIYKFLGTTDYQGVAKTIFIVFPFTVFNCIAFAGRVAKKSWVIFIAYLVIALLSVFGEIGYNFYSKGYADPLLAASLTLAVFWLVLYREDKQENTSFVLILATLATIAASLSKQPGFLWALFSFPLILIVKMAKEKRINWQEIAAIVIACIPVLLWVLGPGRHFTQNAGVIGRSTGSSVFQLQDMFLAVKFSVVKYWLKSPCIFLLYLGMIFSLRKSITQQWVFISYILPGTVLWFMFGSYDVRLGLQLLSLCAIFIAYNNFYPLNKFSETPINVKKLCQVFMALGAISFIFFSLNENYIKHGFVRGYLYPLNGPKTIVDHVFNQDGDRVYTQIYQHPEKKLWIPSIFISALFENNNKIITPPETADIQEIYNNILFTKPDYLMTGDYPDQFPAEDAFKKIAKICPGLFKEWGLHKQKSKLDYRIFEFNDSQKAQVACEKKLLG